MPKDLWKLRKSRSNAQKESARANFAKSRSSDKENHDPASQKVISSLQRNIKAIRSKLSKTEVRLQEETEKTLEARRLHNNTRRRGKRKQRVEDGLREELQQEKRLRMEAEEATKEAEEREGVAHKAKIGWKKVAATLKRKHRAAKMKLSRALQGKKSAEASLSSLTNIVTTTPHVQLKEKGAFTEGTRELVRELVNRGLPVDQVNGAIQAMSAHNGLEMQDTISTRTIGRIVLEGGIAAQMQVVDEVNHAESLTVSGDGTGLRNVNYESKHATYRTTLYDSPAGPSGTAPMQTPACGERVTRFLGLSSSKDHTAETQMEGWKATNTAFHQVYNESPRGKDMPVNPHALPAKTVGMNSDHAADQKKLGHFWKTWSIESDRILRGERILDGDGAEPVSLTAEELLALIMEESTNKIDEVGGLEAFDRLSMEEQNARNESMRERIYARVGEVAYAAMSPEQQKAADLFIWAGCCMHKELNAVKWGDAAMKAFWGKAALVGPMRLMNKDNAAAVAAGASDAQKRAEAVSEGGGTKLTSLAGAIFNHKDEKKGQGDSFRIFMEREMGYMIRFPDTSNTRYQSHCQAAAELLVNLHLYRKFLLQVRDKKEARKFNNMEKNVFLGLHDIPTLTELAVLTLYGQAISHPYLREVRGPGRQFTNVLDLGPLHDRVAAHCRAVIANPGLLLSSEASSSTGSMDGKGWDRPEAVFAVHALAPTLPHLEGALIAFFEGALEGWMRFSTEYEAGGDIALASTDERERAYMKATNDDNEGALGMLRTGSRWAPNMTLHQRNARVMYKRNNTKLYIKTILSQSASNRKYLRRRARLIDKSGIERLRRQAQAKADQEAVEKKRAKDRERAEKKAKVDAALDNVVCRLDVAAIEASPGTNAAMDLELAWFRRIDPKVPKIGEVKSKPLKLGALLDAVRRYNAGETSVNSQTPDPAIDVESDIDSGNYSD